MNEPASRFLAGAPRLHYLEWNPTGARTLLLLHGNSANAWWWGPMARALAGANLRVLALDLRGHGDSEWVRPPDYSPADYADDLARLIQAADAEGGIAVGHSMGGIAVLAFALRYHRLARAAAANPTHNNPQIRASQDSSAAVPLAERDTRAPLKDVVIGVGFLLALAAFLLSIRNAQKLRALGQPNGRKNS